MKFSDFFLYICLLIFGFAFGWFVRGEKAPSSGPILEIDYAAKKTENLDNHPSVEEKRESKPDESSFKSKIVVVEKKETPVKLLNVLPVEQTNQVSTPPDSIIPHEKQSQSELVVTIQKALNKNEFFEAICFLKNSGANKNTAQFEEAFNIITKFIQAKVETNESLNILADIEKGLASFPGWWPLIILKGRVYVATGNFEEGAKNLYKEMFYIINENDQKELLKFVRLLRSKRIEELKTQKLTLKLIDYYEQLIVDDASFVLYYFELGKLYAEKHDYYSALVLLKIVVSDEIYGKEAEAIIEQIIVNQELEAAQQIVKLENMNAIEIPIIHLNDRIFVFVRLNEKIEAKFLIDTGATISLLSNNLAYKLGFKADQLKDLRWFQTAGGMVKQPVVKISSLTLANVKMQEVMAAVSKGVGSDFDGLLGMNFLGRFNFEINQERNLLILKQK